MKADLNITFYREKRFKETPIGKIPEDWNVIKLGAILNLKNGERPKISKTGKIPIYGANGVMGFTTEFLIDNDFTIIIGRVGASGEVHLGQGKIWVSDNAIYSENYNKHKTYLPFIYYLLKLKNLSRFATKTTHPIITQTFLKSLSIQLPPLPEQKAIAHVLSTVDEAIRKTNEIIERIKRFKKGLMQELLTRGIGHKEFKDTEIGRIPKEWIILKLSKVLKLGSGKPRPSEISKVPTKDAPYPVYGGNGILGYADKFLFNKETIVIGRVGEYCGAVYRTSGPSWITDNALYAKEIASILDLDFLKYLLIFLNLNKYKKKSGQPLLTQTIIYSIKIPIPSLKEQRKIAEILSTVDKRLEVEKKRKEKLERIKKALMDLLLTGKVRIKVIKSA